jgi:hypothetical protein
VVYAHFAVRRPFCLNEDTTDASAGSMKPE